MSTEPIAPARRISAANLTVPKKALPPAGPFERLLRLSKTLGSNKTDAVTALIVACIGEGWNTERQIVSTLYRLGFDNRHVAIVLKRGGAGRWRRNADKTYSLLT